MNRLWRDIGNLYLGTDFDGEYYKTRSVRKILDQLDAARILKELEIPELPPSCGCGAREVECSKLQWDEITEVYYSGIFCDCDN